MTKKAVAVIPARGGSKGIPRKNLRPLAGKPMIFYAINACMAAKSIDMVVVTTDDEEIALVAERFGAKVIHRPPALADDQTTLDPVISHAIQSLGEDADNIFYVATIQPTSPLVEATDIDAAINILDEMQADTVISVVEDKHLTWTVVEDKPRPLYKARVNRQQLPPSFRETGTVIACTRQQLQSGTRIGEKIELLTISKDRSYDIDSVSDLFLCESILTRKKIVFTVIGHPAVGLGHAYRAVMIANEFPKHEITFVCEEKSSQAADFIAKNNYNCVKCPDGEILNTVIALQPNLVINDILDTDQDYIKAIKRYPIKVANFEDLGTGAEYADLVINALYPSPIPLDKTLTGEKYFCLRDEFLLAPSQPAPEVAETRNILVSFGGVDEGNLTTRVTSLIAPYCIENAVHISIVVGPGFSHHETLTGKLASLPGLSYELARGTARISDYMQKSDLAITSGGRTVLELAAMQTPTIVICQNRRETTHTFASSNNGVLNLGVRHEVDDSDILKALIKVASSSSLRRLMRDKMCRLDIRDGKSRVINHISSLLE